MRESIQKVAGEIIDICHRLYAKGFVTATDGNVSARLENGNILTTRTSVNKGMVTPDDRSWASYIRDGICNCSTSSQCVPIPRSYRWSWINPAG
ncbi:MAG: class II aldolase/adducin family protein [Ignavibacteriales bacterium]|nr:class II aldolase/adducin family protein [Ignavibacteriales bacterium]